MKEDLENKIINCPQNEQHQGQVGWCIYSYNKCKIKGEYIEFDGKLYKPCYLQQEKIEKRRKYGPKQR